MPKHHRQSMKKSKKVIKNEPELTIERVIFDGKTGKIKAIDIHNETDGCAYYFEDPAVHFHGYNKKKV